LLLDQNLVKDMYARYENLIPKECCLLLGPNYALLHSSYAIFHQQSGVGNGLVERILVYFGGVDENNLTSKAISAYIELNNSDIELDVVLPTNSRHVDKIIKYATNHKSINLHSNLSTLAPLMNDADLSIGAGGATSWERCCVGLPAITVTDGENQKMTNSALAKLDAIKFLGRANSVSARKIYDSLHKLIKLPDKLKKMSISAKKLCDGNGCKRVAGYLEKITSN
jgi:UDP-2,4-diacetamido-2,4,6-trideoxy-beta-L-altropyranose hydrolase